MIEHAKMMQSSPVSPGALLKLFKPNEADPKRRIAPDTQAMNPPGNFGIDLSHIQPYSSPQSAAGTNGIVPSVASSTSVYTGVDDKLQQLKKSYAAQPFAGTGQQAQIGSMHSKIVPPEGWPEHPMLWALRGGNRTDKSQNPDQGGVLWKYINAFRGIASGPMITPGTR